MAKRIIVAASVIPTKVGIQRTLTFWIPACAGMTKAMIMLSVALLASPALALTSVNLLADNSLSLPLTEIIREYSRTHDVAISTSFTATKEEVGQIAEGSVADLLISARPGWLARLQERGLVDVHSQTLIASNALVLAGAANNPLPLHFNNGFPIVPMSQAYGGDMTIVVGNPEYLVQGSVALESLRHMDALPDVEPYLTTARQIPDMVDTVAQGNYGLLFASDVQNDPRLKVLAQMPATSYTPVRYSASVLAGENMNSARDLLEYLRSKPARLIFQKYGFVIE